MKSVLLLLLSCLAFGAEPDPNCPILAQHLVRNEKFVRESDFNVNRDFVYYTDHLGHEFTNKLRPVNGLAAHWVDLGAGNAAAMRRMYRPVGRQPSVDAKAVYCTAVGFAEPKDILSVKESEMIAKEFGKDAFQYLAGLFHELSDATIGRADVITDVYGVLSYTPDPSRDLRKALNLLNPNGILIMEIDPKGFAFEGKSGDVAWVEYLKTIGGIEVTRVEPRKDLHDPNGTKVKSMVIELTRTKGPISVPELQVTALFSNTPPARTLRLKP